MIFLSRQTVWAQAVAEVLDDNGTESMRSVASKYGIPKSTLKHYVDKAKTVGTGNMKFAPNYKGRQILSIDEERELVRYLLQSSKLNYALSTKETRILA